MKTIFFDYGNVLVKYNHMRSCHALAEFTSKSAEDIYSLIFASGLEEEHYNKGEYSDDQWYRKCTEMLELSNCPYGEFTERWGDIFAPNPLIEPLLAVLKSQADLFIVSNTNGLHWAWSRKNMPVLSTYFPDRTHDILSHEVASRKPERRIYEYALERANVQPSEAFFVDDREGNVRAFEELGVHGFAYGANDRIEPLKDVLISHGLLL